MVHFMSFLNLNVFRVSMFCHEFMMMTDNVYYIVFLCCW